MNTATLKTARFVQSFQTIDFFRIYRSASQKLVKLIRKRLPGKNNLSLDLLREGCMRCYIPEEPEFELQSGTENIYRVLNPQQWEINGLRCTLENTTWRQLGASDDTDNTEFACLTIEKL